MYTFPQTLRAAYEALPIPLVIDQLIDGQVVPLLMSQGFCKLVGMDREKAMAWFSRAQFERLHPDDVGNVARVSEEFAHHRSEYNLVFRSMHPDGYHYIHAVGAWMTMPDGTELAVITYTDISDAGRAITALTEQYNLFRQDVFYTDPMTALPNMNYFVQFGDERLHSLRIHGQTPVLVYFDVNSMQSYNNQYGFEKGDDLIRLIAAVLRESFPEALLVRGVEDHLIVLTAFEDQASLVERIESANRRIRTEAYGNTTGVQAGICVLTDEAFLAEAMDHAKHAIRQMGSDLNQMYRFYSSEADDLYWNQRYIVENFDKALENGWFRVYYQIIRDVPTAHGFALEALARWVDPVRGIISPGEFIPVLSKYHLLHRMDLYIFEQVCREVRQRREGGLPLCPVSVNFARQDFDHVDVVAELNRLVDQYRVADAWDIGKDSFIIEITEQDMATAPDRFYQQLAAIRANGFRLWLDDFGSGYSSLNVFSQFEVDLIKFDMDLLRNLDRHNGANREILRSLVEMCRKLGIHTLAEGVETLGQLQFLREIGCELAQGYYFHRPEPLEAILYRRNKG